MGDIIPFRRFKDPEPVKEVELLYCPDIERMVEFPINVDTIECGGQTYVRYFDGSLFYAGRVHK